MVTTERKVFIVKNALVNIRQGREYWYALPLSSEESLWLGDYIEMVMGDALTNLEFKRLQEENAEKPIEQQTTYYQGGNDDTTTTSKGDTTSVCRCGGNE